MSLKITEETTFLLDMTNALQFGPELHTNANAASDPNGNEADTTTGFTATGLTGTGANVFESQSSVVNVGTYAVHANSNDTPTVDCGFYVDLQAAPFNFVNGENGIITFDVRHVGSGGNWSANLSSTPFGVDVPITLLLNSETSFQQIEDTWGHNANRRYFNLRELSASNDGGVYFDNLSVRKVL